jgi:hypothetical protein
MAKHTISLASLKALVSGSMEAKKKTTSGTVVVGDTELATFSLKGEPLVNTPAGIAHLADNGGKVSTPKEDMKGLKGVRTSGPVVPENFRVRPTPLRRGKRFSETTPPKRRTTLPARPARPARRT